MLSMLDNWKKWKTKEKPFHKRILICCAGPVFWSTYKFLGPTSVDLIFNALKNANLGFWKIVPTIAL